MKARQVVREVMALFKEDAELDITISGECLGMPVMFWANFEDETLQTGSVVVAGKTLSFSTREYVESVGN